MNNELKQKAFNIYAVLGELSVLKKQAEQRLVQINDQIQQHEAALVELSQSADVPTIDEAPQGEEA